LLLLVRLQIDPRRWTNVDPTEMVQEALSDARRSFHQFHGESEQQLATWLRRMLAHAMANLARTGDQPKSDLERSLEATLEESSVRLQRWMSVGELSDEQIASQNEQLLRLAGALAMVPHDQRLVLEMKHLRGYSVDRICEETGRSKAAVAGQLFRGLKRLRTLLDDPGKGDGAGEAPK
jgi:RNA polymerase sigma-70 factor (subfamily 1)